MKNKGFVTSALLYGILSVFIVLLLSTVAITGNRKLATDKIKQSALDDVQDLTTDETCFTTEPYTYNDKSGYYKITGYDWENCPMTVFIPKNAKIVRIESYAFSAVEGKNLINVTIPGTISEIGDDAFSNNSGVIFIIKNKNIDLDLPDQNDVDEGEVWGASDSTYRLE
ncbi:MAG: leucine-rich repeat protein [Bacilli bacterium]|nr:leucine-rich repeat protein [Bacilli bacterium]